VKRRVKADRLTPAYPLQGALIRRLTDGVAPFSSTAPLSSFALAGEAVPFGSQKPPSDVHLFSRWALGERTCLPIDQLPSHPR
jgi:hypothetical protein